MLLATKLYIPQRAPSERQRPFLVARPHLIDKLDAGLEGKLTLVATPAGFGKTTLIAEWIQHNDDLRIKNDEDESLIHNSSLQQAQGRHFSRWSLS